MVEVQRKFVGIAVGDSFSCYHDLQKRIDETEKLTGVPVYIRDCTTLKGAAKRRPHVVKKARPKLLYHSLRYICVLGRPDPQRDAKLVKQGLPKDLLCKGGVKCSAEIKVGLSEDSQYLEVKRIVDVHNHKLSPKLLNLVLANRQTPKDSKRTVNSPSTSRHSKLQSPVQNSPNAVRSTSRKSLESRDVTNIFDKLTKDMKRKNEEDNSTVEKKPRVAGGGYFCNELDDFFPEIKTEIHKDYRGKESKKVSKRLGFKLLVEEMYDVKDSIVEVYQEGIKPQAIFFQTKEMQASFAAFPEVLLIDSNYNILELGMRLYIVANGDGNGECNIVSIWLLVRENAKNIGFLVDMFMDHNPEWFNAKVVMLDWEFPERRVIFSRFSDSATFTCYHHAVRSFQKDVYAEKDIGFENEEERDTCMKLFKKMALSKDLNSYLNHFERFRLYAPEPLYTSFLTNWHQAKDQWVDGLKDPNAYFLNQKHCRIDAIDQIIKSICNNCRTVQKFFNDLKKSIGALQLERMERSLNIPIKGPLITSEFHIAEKQYQNFLTPYGFSFVRRQMHGSANVRIEKSISDTTCSIQSAKYGRLDTSTTFCPCVFFSVTGLPCSHIFAVRRDKGLPTYEAELCSCRWTMRYLRKTNDIIDADSDLVPDALLGCGEVGQQSPIDSESSRDRRDTTSNDVDVDPFVPSYPSSIEAEPVSAIRNLEEELIFDEVDPDGDLSREFEEGDDGEKEKETNVVLGTLLSKL